MSDYEQPTWELLTQVIRELGEERYRRDEERLRDGRRINELMAAMNRMVEERRQTLRAMVRNFRALFSISISDDFANSTDAFVVSMSAMSDLIELSFHAATFAGTG